MAHTELNLYERLTIADVLNAKIAVRKIATEIGSHVLTVYESSSVMAIPTKNRLNETDTGVWLRNAQRPKRARDGVSYGGLPIVGVIQKAGISAMNRSARHAGANDKSD
ncbi:MAG: hypothetical protein R8G34_13700 [Paracoccaceae bacterium]|nr:hypothetical protein [Paracoccaceae bacterium]